MKTPIVGATLKNNGFIAATINNESYFIKGNIALKRNESKENTATFETWDMYDFSNGIFSFKETVKYLEQIP